MIFDIRNISNYFPNVHSRYYIDSNGIVYTSISKNTTRIRVNGVVINVNKQRREILPKLNNANNLLGVIPGTHNKYYILNDGTVLQRLATSLKEHNAVYVCLITLTGNDRGNYLLVSRLVAGCFIGDVQNKEVHHIDRNRQNNKVNNLKILSMQEHRGKGNFNINHGKVPND